MRVKARLGLAALLALLALSWGCTNSRDLDGGWWTEDGYHGDGGGDAADTGDDDHGAEADGADGPLDPLTVGSPGTFEIATWNLHNFPADAEAVGRVAELLRRMDLDLVAVEEVADAEAFADLVSRLPGFEGVLSDHVYATGESQKIGFILRSESLQVRAWDTHFDDDSYDFPRPSLEVDLVAHAPSGAVRTFMAMGQHLKAGVATEDADRRRAACQKLAARVEEVLAIGVIQQVVLLGDFNDELADPEAENVFRAFLDAPERFEALTAPPYLEGQGLSYLPYPSFIDHVIATDSWLAGRGASRALAVRLDQAELGFDYESAVSDHLPVVVILPW